MPTANLTREGLVLSRYASGLTGNALVANSGFAAADAPTIQSNIVAMTDLLDINRNGSVDVTDATIISRKIAGFDNAAATAGIPAASLGPGGASAVNSFLLSGCGNTAWQIGGNATSGNSVLGSNSAFDLDVRTAGANIFLRNGANHGIRIYQFNPADSPTIIGGDAANGNGGTRGAIIAGGGDVANDCYEPSNLGYNRPCRNYVDKNYSTVSGGIANIATESSATVSGGRSNTANAEVSSIGGGIGNLASGVASVVVGGSNNRAVGLFAAVGGGAANYADGPLSVVSGGRGNLALGGYSVVAGGWLNEARGYAAFAAGMRAWANAERSFVWGGHETLTTNSNGVGSFTAYAPGGVFFYVGAPGTGGCSLTSASGWACSSDRNSKTHITNLNTSDILRRVLAMPVTRWSYKGTENVNNIGPMAQDFWRAFGLGDSDKTIASMNMSGVALAAIQGLHQVVAEKDRKIEALEARLKRLETAITSRVDGRKPVSKHPSLSSTNHR